MSDKKYENFGISVIQSVKSDARYEDQHLITITDGVRTEIIGKAKTEAVASDIYSAVIAGIEMVSTIIKPVSVEEAVTITADGIKPKKPKKEDIKGE